MNLFNANPMYWVWAFQVGIKILNAENYGFWESDE
jgi:hypothetical protein